MTSCHFMLHYFNSFYFYPLCTMFSCVWQLLWKNFMMMMMMMIFNRMHCPLIVVVPDWSVHHCRCACSRTWLDERSATRARSSGWPAATKVGLLLFPFSVLIYRVFVPKCDLEWGLYSYIFLWLLHVAAKKYPGLHHDQNCLKYYVPQLIIF